MGRYVLRRLLWMPLVLFVLVTLAFFLIRLAPGGPFSAERSAPQEVLDNLNARYGFDNPLLVQYAAYLGIRRAAWDVGLWDLMPNEVQGGLAEPFTGVVQGDLGQSFKFKDRTVNEIIAVEIGPTAVLGLSATVLALAIGLTAGVVGAVRQNSVFDYASMSVATFGMSIPNFVTGPVLVLVFAMWLGWLPVSGFSAHFVAWPVLVVAGLYAAWRVAEWVTAGRRHGITLGREAAAFWFAALVAGTTCVAALLVRNESLVLPAIVLALPFASRIARLMRAGMLEVIHQDYVRTARAKGLAEPVVVVRHALKGGILPVVSYLGPAMAGILTGSLVVERIFAIPGVGREFVEAALARDYFLILGIVVLDGILLVGFNLLVDVAYGFLDPRIRYD